MDIEDLFEEGVIAPRVHAADKRQALSVVAELAARHHGLKAAPVLSALVKREAQASTGVGHGVATPHARLKGLDQMRGIFVRLETPVDFGALDEKPVDLVFALLSPAESAGDHLQALARISRVMRSAELRSQLRQAAGADALRALLTRDARPSAA